MEAPFAELERLGEASYDAMYDARPSAARDCFEAARRCFRLAIEEAEKVGDHAEVERLKRRLAEIIEIYNRQFRYVGY